jgi:hypothetical protein
MDRDLFGYEAASRELMKQMKTTQYAIAAHVTI